MTDFRLSSFLSGALVTTTLVAGATQFSRAGDGVLRCRELILEDANGNERGRWTVDREGMSRLQLLDPDGDLLAELAGVGGGDHVSGLTLFSHDSSPSIVLRHEQTQHGAFDSLEFLDGDEGASVRIREDWDSAVTMQVGRKSGGQLWGSFGWTPPNGPPLELGPPFAALGVTTGEDSIGFQLGEHMKGMNPYGPHLRLKQGETVKRIIPEGR